MSDEHTRAVCVGRGKDWSE